MNTSSLDKLLINNPELTPLDSDLNSISKNGFIRLNNEIYKVKDTYSYNEVDWNTLKPSDDTYSFSELKLSSSTTKETIYLEWDSENKFYTSVEINSSEITLDEEKISLSMVGDIDDGSVISFNDITFVYSDDDTFAATDDDMVFYQFFVFLSDESENIISVTVCSEDGEDFGDLEIYISSPVKDNLIEILQD